MPMQKEPKAKPRRKQPQHNKRKAIQNTANITQKSKKQSKTRHNKRMNINICNTKQKQIPTETKQTQQTEIVKQNTTQNKQTIPGSITRTKPKTET